MVTPGEAASPGRRRGVFDLADRAAPGLYLVAWGLAVAGSGSLFIGLASGRGSGAVLAFVLGVAGVALGLAAGAGSQALQRRADGAPFAGPSPVLVFGAALGLALVGGYVIDAIHVVPAGPLVIVASVVVSAVLSIGLVGLLVVSPGALSWRAMGLRLPAEDGGSIATDVAWGVALAVPALFVGSLLAAALVALLGVTPDPTIPVARDAGGLAITLLAAAVIAPLWEEIFFRGFTTTAWAWAAGSRAAIVRGAIFFALAHVLTLAGSDFGTSIRIALVAFTVRLPIGLLLGWVFLRRRTLVAPIVLHATYNAIPVLLMALAPGFGRG